MNIVEKEQRGLVRELNPGPLAPQARIIPRDQQALLNNIFSKIGFFLLANVIACYASFFIII